jgi:hypothetical protein
MNLRRILLSSVAALTLTSAAFAAGASDGSDAVVLANDGTGDYLVYPAYFANTQGWSTNLKVVNSNTTHAIVAKVVIRESVLSNEKLDFPIYLSPGDVWEGSLSNVGGNVILTSSDDSMYVSGSGATTVFANTSTVTKALASTVAPENANMGYVEVFGIAAVAGNDADVGGASWTSGPIAKYKIRDKFLTDLNGALTGVPGDWTEVDANSLYGQEVISANNGSGNLAMTIPATALENVTGTGPIEDKVIAVDTTLENSSNITGSTLLANIELALGKSNVYVTHYENADSSAMADTVLLMNQPMKKYRTPVTTGIVMSSLNTTLGYDMVAVNTTPRAGTNDYSGADILVASATALNNYAFSYVATPRDQAENTPTTTPDQWSGFHTTSTTTRCNTELCYLDVAASSMSAYVAGWVNVNVIQDTPTHTLPVIPAVMTAKNVGGTNVTNIIYPAYK